MCWNVMMAVSVCAHHPSNVLTIRGGWAHLILSSDWSMTCHAGLWLVSGWPWGHTWTRDTGHVTWCWQQPGMQHCTETSSYQHPVMTFSTTLATLQTSLLFCVFLTLGLQTIISNHCSAGSGCIGQVPGHSLTHWHQFLPLLSSAASKCSKLDQKPEMECG